MQDDPYPPLTPGVAEVAAREIQSIAVRAYSNAAIHYAQNAETPVRYSKSNTASQVAAVAAVSAQFENTQECKQLEVAFSNLEALVMWRADPSFDDTKKKEWQANLLGWDKYMQSQAGKGALPDSVLQDYKAAAAIATIRQPLQNWVDIAQRRERSLGQTPP